MNFLQYVVAVTGIMTWLVAIGYAVGWVVDKVVGLVRDARAHRQYGAKSYSKWDRLRPDFVPEREAKRAEVLRAHEAITKRDNVTPTRRKCANCGVVHEIPNSNCVDDREYREHIKTADTTPPRAYTPAETLTRMAEELFGDEPSDAIKTAMNQTALGRAICAVTNHQVLPILRPCNTCLDYAGVILERLEK